MDLRSKLCIRFVQHQKRGVGSKGNGRSMERDAFGGVFDELVHRAYHELYFVGL